MDSTCFEARLDKALNNLVLWKVPCPWWEGQNEMSFSLSNTNHSRIPWFWLIPDNLFMVIYLLVLGTREALAFA